MLENIPAHFMHLLVVFVSFLFTLHRSFFLLYLHHLQNAFLSIMADLQEAAQVLDMKIGGYYQHAHQVKVDIENKPS